MLNDSVSIGDFLRDWRGRRRLSQLALAADAEISQRHLSFVESGRAMPSRDMVLRLAEQLDIPLRDRNAMLAAAGFAPVYSRRPFDAPELGPARAAVELILKGNEPHPALAVDRHWTLLSANRSATALLSGIGVERLAAPVNVLRISLHPEGLAPRILNFHEWRAHVLGRLAHEIDISADPALVSLLEELRSYPAPAGAKPHRRGEPTTGGGIAVPLELASEAGRMSFLSTTTVFGTAVDVTLAELTVESFFPADAETARAMARLAETAS